VYILKKENNKFRVAYIGAIDDNPRSETEAKKKYVENAVDALLNNEKVSVTRTRAIGCTIKWRHF